MPPTPELTPKQQWNELVKNSRSVLIVAHRNSDGDALGSALGLKLGLEKLGKEVTVVAAGQSSDPLSFLPGIDSVQHELTIHKELLLILDESQSKISNVSLKRISETKLIVVVTPQEGMLTSNNVRIEEGTYNVDLVVCLDCAQPERMGSIYEDNPALFYEVPVVNIDHHAGNTNFGKVNIVDVTASSTSEIMVSLLETIGKEVPGGIIDADIATCLLTGVTTDTGSFQNANTTPKSLTIAAQLVAAGARQQEIVRTIYRTRNLSTLRLWGRALSYIKEEPALRFAWSSLTKADFVAAQAKQEEASGVIDELFKTASGLDFVLLLSERDGGVNGSFRSVNPSTDVSILAALFNGGGHTQAAAFFMPDCQIKDKEQEIINSLRKHLGGATEPVQSTPEKQEEVPVAPSPEEEQKTDSDSSTVTDFQLAFPETEDSEPKEKQKEEIVHEPTVPSITASEPEVKTSRPERPLTPPPPPPPVFPVRPQRRSNNRERGESLILPNDSDR